MKLKKKFRNWLKVFLSVAILLSFSLGFLFFVPKAVNLAQSNIFKATKIESFNLAPEVKAEPLKLPVLKILDKGQTPPNLSAQAVLAQDLDSEKILYQKNITLSLSPASTTKLMTALVALSHYKSDSILEVKPEDIVDGSKMGLNVGEKLSFRSLLYGMLLNSGNDASYTIASNYPGGVPMFVLQMNKKSIELGLEHTHFENPAGFDGSRHYSSALDLAKIAKVAALNPELQRVVGTKETLVSSLDNSKMHHLQNLNRLLGENGVLGIKTGYTERSGENLVGLVDRNGRKILTVVLSSDDRFGETEKLMDWVYSNFEWKYE